MLPDMPWHYSGDLMTVEFRTDPSRVAELLPEPLTLVPDEHDPGAVAMIFADWQSCGDDLSELDLLFYGADSAAELARIPELVPTLSARGALWIVSLKGKLLKVKDVEVMAAARAAGLVDSKVCSFSETRTALRFTRRRGA